MYGSMFMQAKLTFDLTVANSDELNVSCSVCTDYFTLYTQSSARGPNYELLAVLVSILTVTFYYMAIETNLTKKSSFE